LFIVQDQLPTAQEQRPLPIHKCTESQFNVTVVLTQRHLVAITQDMVTFTEILRRRPSNDLQTQKLKFTVLFLTNIPRSKSAGLV